MTFMLEKLTFRENGLILNILSDIISVKKEEGKGL